MGGGSYSYESRKLRTASFSARGADGSYEKSADDVFEQNKVKKVHESMIPSNAKIRECRDNEDHPLTTPIIIALDVTGSMGHIPEHLMREGLPKVISQLMKKGVAHPSILFLAVGDSVFDKGPLQVGQFEGSDEKMDMWLQRMWIEKGGGGNPGESYLWAWYYANHHTVTDSWEKRKEKGFLFTIGDEPCLPIITSAESAEVMKDINQIGQGATAKDLLKECRKQWEVYHIEMSTSDSRKQSWKDLIGSQNVISVARDGYQDVADKISDVISSQIKHKDFSLATKEEEELATEPAKGKKSDEFKPETLL